MLWLSGAIGGLLLVEQVYRNAREEERWGIKFLCLGLGAVFAYDFFMYAEALLFRKLNPQLWQARGLVSALVVPWLVVAIARNRNWRMDVHVSRHVVFHTVTLMGAGLYLLGMAVIGYFIKYLGGAWGGVLQASFLAASGALLFTLLFSGTLRARLRVFLSKHFFSYRYDYRVEWLKFTEGLAALDDEAPEGIIRAMAPIALSPGGFLLYRGASGNLDSSAEWELDIPNMPTMGNLVDWVTRTAWVIDLREWRNSPDMYDDLELPDWLRQSDKLWLVVPLLFKETVEGLLFLARTDLKTSVNWEDRDLLKTAGRQAAALLAQQRASRALVEARQFDAFNRLSAYVIHDLKNILAQQSLMVANAQKHRENPAFVDDMISTVENSVKRMQRLMDQMRRGMRSAEFRPLDLAQLLDSAVATRSNVAPRPILEETSATWVTADRERLSTVFGHLLQNAQEATPAEGSIRVRLDLRDSLAVVEIQDTGCGMSENFVRKKLFKPFESTKGLTGMGIGAFESREYVRQLGGDITVASAEGQGTTFTIILPISRDSDFAENFQECDADTLRIGDDVTH
jgi:putative PEP-CTERM system histidine kinase